MENKKNENIKNESSKEEKKVDKSEKLEDKKNNFKDNKNFNKDKKEGFNRDNRPFNKDRKEGFNKDNRNSNRDSKDGFNKDNRNFNKDKKEGFNRDNKPFNKDKKPGFNKDNKNFNKDGRNSKDGFNKDRNFGKDKKDFGRKFDDRKKDFLDDVVEVVDPAIEKRDARKTHLQGQEKNKKNKSLNEHKMREDRNPNLILKPAKKKNKANHKTKSDSDLEFESKVENVGEIKIPESITVKDFSESLGVNSAQVISKLIALGIMAGLNQEIDFDCASLIAEEFGKTVVLETPEITDENEILSLDYEDKAAFNLAQCNI